MVRILLILLTFWCLGASAQFGQSSLLKPTAYASSTPTDPGDTLPVTSGLQGWWRADTGVVLSGGTLLQWSDLSGNNHHFDATGEPAPTPTTGGQNGHSYLAFRTNSPTQNLKAYLFPDLTAVTVFVVGRKSATDQNGALIGKWSASKGWMVFGYSWRFYTNGAQANITSTTTPLVYSASYDATAKKVYINGANVQSTTGGTLTATGINYLEIGRYDNSTNSTGLADADIYEVIIYNRALSDTERGQVETYLNTRYAIY